MCKERDSKYEILRIIAMVFIVLGHIITQSNNNSSSIILLNRVGAIYLSNFSRIAVNLFLMLGIWFMIDKKFNAKRIIKLWGEVFIYAVPITLILFVLNPKIENLKNCILCFFPILGKRLWFASIYMILLIFAPILNDICENLSRKKLGFYCFLQIIFISVYSSITPFQDTTICNIFWFFFMYFFVYYLKKYDIQKKYSTSKLFLIAGTLYFIFTTLALLIQELISENMLGYNIFIHIYKLIFQWLADFKSIPNFTISVIIFVGFLNMNSFKISLINKISRSTFAVYIIHQIPGFYSVLWNEIFCINKYINTLLYIPYIFLVLIIIFVISIIIDKIRINTIEKKFLQNNLINKICLKIDCIYNEFV